MSTSPKTEVIQKANNLKLLLTIDEVAHALSLGRTFVYALIMRNEIASVKIGRARRIPITALHQYIELQSIDSQR